MIFVLKKFSAALLTAILLSGGTADAYDLPKLKPDKKITANAEQKSPMMLKSDWTNAELLEQKLRALTANGKQLAPNDPARLAADKNFVFVAFLNDAPYFLDKYSIKIRRNDDGTQVWEQKIFPITKKFSPRNAKAVTQRFCLADGKFYNSTKAKDALSDVPTETDKIFLTECFKVGYYFAFGKEAQGN